ncbi:MAG: DUF1579 domain-containing protein [Armatimonadetes bacterium]|nr:DUF1579 domain-containing protein [Armatimonadota bacterium]
MEPPEITGEHRWLQKHIGTWEFESIMDAECEDHMTGKEVVTAMGESWIHVRGSSAMGESLVQIGYDPVKQEFIGTWAGTMMHMIWNYRGQRDESGNLLTLEAEGPSFMNPGETCLYHDCLLWIDDNNREFYSEYQKSDGTWEKFMHMKFRRIN